MSHIDDPYHFDAATTGQIYFFNPKSLGMITFPTKVEHLSESSQPAPNRASTLPTGGVERKTYPIATGVLDYFPDAIVALAHISHIGNEQHNPGQPLHWARGKSVDQDDTLMRHFMQRGTLDVDGVRHSAKMAWRALAILQLEIEAAQQQTESSSSGS